MDTLLVGSEVPRVDGLAKVTGKAVYGDDIIMNNMLYGVCRYVDIPAGRIDALDLSEAEKVPGVVRIATWNDIPGQRKLGAIVPDHPPIIDKEIAYRGDVVAVVAAETYEAACIAGLGLIQAPMAGLRTLIEQGHLVEVLPAYRAEPMPVTLLYAHRRHLPQRVQAFMGWLADTSRPYLDA